MKNVTIDELKEMMTSGKAPTWILYKNDIYYRTPNYKDYYRECKIDNYDVNKIYLSEVYYTNNELIYNKNISDMIEIPKPSILDSKEKEYISKLIEPFRDKIKYIVKYNYAGSEYIKIYYTDFEGYLLGFELPEFKENTMYKNMEVDKAYTVEELGL